jgi:hypothetical protein
MYIVRDTSNTGITSNSSLGTGLLMHGTVPVRWMSEALYREMASRLKGTQPRLQ